MGEAASQETETTFQPIPLDTIRIDSVLCFDMYLYKRPATPGGQAKYVLYRTQNLPINHDHIQRLTDAGIRTLFVKMAERKNYLKYVEENLNDILSDQEIDTSEKASVVYETATNIVQDTLGNPANPQNIKRSTALVEHTLTALGAQKNAVKTHIAALSGSYTIYTHSVNVTVYSLALANQLGMDIEGLTDLGLGALLHDVGKTRVDEKILDKPGSLTEEEMQLVRMHPEWGLQILKDAELSPTVYEVVQEHHERCDGSGYPQALLANEIHPFARIVCMINVFDALTTNRPYRPAYSFFEALRVMRDDMAEAFDQQIWRQFVMMLGDTMSGSERPGEATGPSPSNDT